MTLFPNMAIFWGTEGLGLQHVNFAENTPQPITPRKVTAVSHWQVTSPQLGDGVHCPQRGHHDIQLHSIAESLENSWLL